MNAFQFLLNQALEPARDYVKINERIVKYNKGEGVDQLSASERAFLWAQSQATNTKLTVEKVIAAENYLKDMNNYIAGFDSSCNKDECSKKIEKIFGLTTKTQADFLKKRTNNDQNSGGSDAAINVVINALTWLDEDLNQDPEEPKQKIIDILLMVLNHQAKMQAHLDYQAALKRKALAEKNKEEQKKNLSIGAALVSQSTSNARLSEIKIPQVCSTTIKSGQDKKLTVAPKALPAHLRNESEESSNDGTIDEDDLDDATPGLDEIGQPPEDISELKLLVISMMGYLFENMAICTLDAAKAAETSKIIYIRKLPTAQSANDMIVEIIKGIKLLQNVLDSKENDRKKKEQLIANITSLRANIYNFHTKIPGVISNIGGNFLPQFTNAISTYIAPNPFVAEVDKKLEQYLTAATELGNKPRDILEFTKG